MTTNICIPYAPGIPGATTPPQWWASGVTSATDANHYYDPDIDDPRWNGAWGQTSTTALTGMSGGTADETFTRALTWTDGGSTADPSFTAGRYVYLQFWVPYAPSPIAGAGSGGTSDGDVLYIGLCAGGSSPALVLAVLLESKSDSSMTADPVPTSTGTTASSGNVAPVLVSNTPAVMPQAVTQVNAVSLPNGWDGNSGSVTWSAAPEWVTETLSVWVQPGTGANSGQWAVALRVPIGLGASPLDNAGPGLSASGFSFWYEYDVNNTEYGGSLSPILVSAYPPTDEIAFGDPSTYSSFPALSSWASCTLGTPSLQCAAMSGISLAAPNIGTISPGWNTLLYNPVASATQPSNTFYALPTNNDSTPIAAGAITATFRIADWGSVPCVPNAPWTQINQTPVPNANSIGAGSTSAPTTASTATASTTLGAAITTTSQPTITVTSTSGFPTTTPFTIVVNSPSSSYPGYPGSQESMTVTSVIGTTLTVTRGTPAFTFLNASPVRVPNDFELANWQVPNGTGTGLDAENWVAELTANPPTKTNHQCVLVEMQGTTASQVFSNTSAFNNTYLVPTSVAANLAKINIAGLTPFSAEPRTVYLSLEVHNMRTSAKKPVTYDQKLLLEPTQVQSSTFSYDGTSTALVAEILSTLRQRPVAPGILDALLPTWRVHTYYDTGKRVNRNGKRYIILGLSTSFSYHAVHVGAVAAWNWRIDGATRVAEFLWVVPVANNGWTWVVPTLQAQAPGDKPIAPQPITSPPATGSDCGPPPKQLVTFLEGVIEVAEWLLCKLKNS